MDEIPETIFTFNIQGAVGTAKGVGYEAIASDTTTGIQWTLRGQLAECVSAALLYEREAATKAERERIAHFVETEMTLDPEGSDFIATAIRSGARP